MPPFEWIVLNSRLEMKLMTKFHKKKMHGFEKNKGIKIRSILSKIVTVTYLFIAWNHDDVLCNLRSTKTKKCKKIVVKEKRKMTVFRGVVKKVLICHVTNKALFLKSWHFLTVQQFFFTFAQFFYCFPKYLYAIGNSLLIFCTSF